MKFGFTEVRLGVAPAIISVVCLPKMRHGEAMEVFLRGNRFPASRAAELGLISRAVPADQLDAAVDEVLADLRLGGPNALGFAKRLVYEVPAMEQKEAFAWTADLSGRLFRGEEAAAGNEGLPEAREAALGGRRGVSARREPAADALHAREEDGDRWTWSSMPVTKSSACRYGTSWPSTGPPENWRLGDGNWEDRIAWLSLQIEHGYWARTIPKEYGGYGAEPDLLETVIMDEEFNRAGVIARHDGPGPVDAGADAARAWHRGAEAGAGSARPCAAR